MRRLVPTQMFQQKRSRKKNGSGIGSIFTRVLRSRAMGGLKHGGSIADIGAGRQTDSSGHCGSSVGKIIAIQVRRRNYAVLVGPKLNLLKHAIGNSVLNDHLARAIRSLA